jgi:Mitochondrial ribosomal subunit S27
MSLRWLAQHCAPLLQVLTRTPLSGAAQGVAPLRLHGTSAGTEQQVFGGQTLLEIRHRIFGDHIGNNLPSGRKVLRKKLVGEKVASYYGLDQKLERQDPFFVDLTAEGCATCAGALHSIGKRRRLPAVRQSLQQIV